MVSTEPKKQYDMVHSPPQEMPDTTELSTIDAGSSFPGQVQPGFPSAPVPSRTEQRGFSGGQAQPSPVHQGVSNSSTTNSMFPSVPNCQVFNTPVNLMFINPMPRRSINETQHGQKRVSGNYLPDLQDWKRPRNFDFMGGALKMQANHEELLTEETKRLEKNRREKQRRQELNSEIKRLADILELPQHGSTEKVSILRQAANELERFKNEERRRLSLESNEPEVPKE